MKTLKDMLDNQLLDGEFRTEYEAIQPEMDVMRNLIATGVSQNMAQKEMSECIRIN